MAEAASYSKKQGNPRGLKVTTTSSSDSVDSPKQTVIVPRTIHTISYCSFELTDEADPVQPKRPSPAQDADSLSTAKNFLLGIAAAPLVAVQASDPSSSSEETSQAGGSPIDLSEAAGRIRPGALKEQLNEEFRRKHPFLPKNLTLSKIVNLREDLLKCCPQINIVAAGWNYFMRVLRHVHTEKRRLYAAACILLAYKFYEEDQQPEALQHLIKRLQTLDANGSISGKSLCQAEVKVYKHLKHRLLVGATEYRETYDLMHNKVNGFFNNSH